MSYKEEKIEFDGVVEEALPNAIFKIRLANDVIVFGYIAGRIRKNSIGILLGDRVKVELSPYDLQKGRITYRYRS